MTKLLDTHQHLLYPNLAGYSWTDEIPQLTSTDFPHERYQELTKEVNLVGSLFMETGANGDGYKAEARFIADLARDPQNGILGLIASCRPETDDGFTDWLDECADLGVVGFRRILHVVDDAISTSQIFRRNVRKIGDRGLPFDLCILPAQYGLGSELIQTCDNTTFVLNHCGVPDIAAGSLDLWRDQISELAKLPNLTCKLSGVLAYCAPGEATAETIKPYVDHVLSVFSADRIVWGSDWPVVDLGNGLPHWISVTEKILDQLSIEDAAAIGYGNATRLYRLDETR